LYRVVRHPLRNAKAFRIGAENRLRRALSPTCAILTGQLTAGIELFLIRHEFSCPALTITGRVLSGLQNSFFYSILHRGTRKKFGAF
jgi:hypothetical protein